jgi:hypothetical protein
MDADTEDCKFIHCNEPTDVNEWLK